MRTSAHVLASSWLNIAISQSPLLQVRTMHTTRLTLSLSLIALWVCVNRERKGRVRGAVGLVFELCMSAVRA